MKQLWQRIFEAARGSAGASSARRTANLSLALHLRGEMASLTQFEAELARISQLLGAPLPVSNGTSVAIWRLLEDEPAAAATRSDIDAWIEAFQASDAARKSLGAYATPTAFADVLARETLVPLLKANTRLRIIDPAAGAGSLLLAAYRCLVDNGLDSVTALASLYGVELDTAARELCVLLLWASQRGTAVSVEAVARQIVLANAVTYDWWGKDPFDALLMNPPWESLRQQRSDPVQAEIRRSTLARLVSSEPGAPGLPPLFSAQGRGDRNLFKLFAELSPHLLREGGRFGAVLPAAFGSDDGMSQLRSFYLSNLALERWTIFENRGKYFQIDARYKFGLLIGARCSSGTRALEVLSFAIHPQAVQMPHVRLDRAELASIGGADQMIPELVSAAERDGLSRMLEHGLPMFKTRPLGRVRYRREVDLTLGKEAGKFWHVDAATPSAAATLLGPSAVSEIVPVLEGRMIGQYDCFQKSWIDGSGRRAQWQPNGDRALNDCRPQYVAHARAQPRVRVAICDVTSATNTRTVLAALVPARYVCGNTAPVLEFETEEEAWAGLAILNSMVFDWQARRIVGGLHLNKFYLARLRWPDLRHEEVSRVAELGAVIAAHHPRGGAAPGKNSASVSLLDAMAEVEWLVARGYCLDAPMLRAMLVDDRGDRRGLWRYFAANPLAREVAKSAIERLESSPDREYTLAA